MSLFDKTEKAGKYVAELQIGGKTDWYYRVLEVNKKKKKNGGEYLTLLLMDKTGKIPAKVWENSEDVLKIIQPGRIHRVSGDVTEFNQKKEIHVQRLRPISSTDRDVNESDYVETATFDTAGYFSQMITSLLGEISNPHLRRLVEEFALEYGDAFREHYGAQKIHHAHPGGLLEHTATLIKLALLVSPVYELDKELVAVGALLHDIGKLAEFKTQPAPETTLEGGLLGHIILGHVFFLKLKDKIEGFPEELSVKIQHLIVSHHGEKGFGSPEVPKTAEAYVLHLMDMLDSRMNIFSELVRTADSGRLFSEFSTSLGSRILVDKK